MAWPWFGPITNNSSFSTLFSIYAKISCCFSVVTEFGYTLDQVNWLGNITSVIYLPVALLVPAICARWNVRRCVRVDNFLHFRFYLNTPTPLVRRRSIVHDNFSMGTVRGDGTRSVTWKILCYRPYWPGNCIISSTNGRWFNHNNIFSLLFPSHNPSSKLLGGPSTRKPGLTLRVELP